MKPGWLPVVGGPCDGKEYYHPGDPRPGQEIPLMRKDGYYVSRGGALVYGKTSRGRYCVSENGQQIVWVLT